MKRTFDITGEDGGTIRKVVDSDWCSIEADLGEAGAMVAARIGDCVDVQAYLVALHEVKEAAFRTWKAKKKLASLAAEKKLAEWKAKEGYRVMPRYTKFNEELAAIQGALRFVEGVMKGLQVKSFTVNAFVDSDFGAQLAEAAGKLSTRRQAPDPERGRVKPPVKKPRKQKKSAVDRDLQ